VDKQCPSCGGFCQAGCERANVPSAQGKPLDLFTPRQRDVVLEMCKGYSNKEIARNLQIAEATVKLHLTSVFMKLGVTNRTRALVKVMHHAITDKTE
jgi:DNA-binding NarL/FixJ family response regulator